MEIRSYESKVNLIPDSRKVEGYALVFNSESLDLGGFTEIIEKNALDEVLEKSDIFCLLNHNKDRGVLARSKYGTGSLQLEIDEIGLRYSFDAPNTTLGDELLEGLKRGDITASSFAFTVEDAKFEKHDNCYLRRITKFKELFDVSPVYQPAYEDTSVALRSIESIKSDENNLLKEHLSEYYEKLKQSLK